MWFQMRKNDISVVNLTNLKRITEFVTGVIFFFSTGLIVSGYYLYRSSITYLEIIRIFLSSIMISLYVFHEDLHKDNVTVITALIGSFWYINESVYYYLSSRYQQLILRTFIIMSHHFMEISFIIIISSLCTIFLMNTLEYHHSLISIVLEITLIILTLYHAFFAYNLIIAKNTQQKNCKENLIPVILDEPQQKSIVFISQ